MANTRDMERYQLSSGDNSKLLIGNYIVYKAIDLNTSTNVIIKTSIDDSKKLLQKEQIIGRNIATKAVVPTQYIIKDKNNKEKNAISIIPTNFDNTLSFYIHNNLLNYLDKLYIAKQLVKSVGCLHKLNFTLGDINPFNILIRNDTKRITPLLINIYNPTIGKNGGVRIATDFYKSPEHLQSGLATRKSDIYSIGMLFHELFNSEKPFYISSKKLNEHTINQKTYVCKKLNSDLKSTPTIIKKIIKKCTQMDPKNRSISINKIYKSLKDAECLKSYSETIIYKMEANNAL